METLKGRAEKLHWTTLYGGTSEGTSTSVYVHFRINGRQVVMRVPVGWSLSEGDEVVVTGAYKNGAMVPAAALNVTTGARIIKAERDFFLSFILILCGLGGLAYFAVKGAYYDPAEVHVYNAVALVILLVGLGSAMYSATKRKAAKQLFSESDTRIPDR